MKNKILILLLFISAVAFGQQGTNTAYVRLINGSAGTTGTNNGSFYFDTGLGLYQFRQGGAWVGIGGPSGWPLTGTGTLTGNVSMVQAGFNTTFSGIGKVSFSPTSTSCGFNMGSFAGVPASVVNADLYFNSTTGYIETPNIFLQPSATTGQVLIQSKLNGAGASSNVTFTSGNGTTATGNASLNTGSASSGTSGNVQFSSGQGTTGSGIVQLLTGQANSSGNVNIFTGIGTAGTSGDIIFTTGTASGTRGIVKVTNPAFQAVHIQGGSAAPTQAAGTGAGTGPTLSFTRATDLAGTVNVTTGTTPTASGIVTTVTFNGAYGATPTVILTPANAVTAALNGTQQVFANGASTTTFTITAGTAALTASTAYVWSYQVIQ